MSIQVMSHVWNNSKLKNNALLLMLAIADHADDNGIAYPSRKRLAKKCRVTVQTLDKLVDQCQQAGELVVYSRRSGELNLANHYVIVGFCDLDKVSKERDLGIKQSIPDVKPTKKLSESIGSSKDVFTSKDDFTRVVNTSLLGDKDDFTRVVNTSLPESSLNRQLNHQYNHQYNANALDAVPAIEEQQQPQSEQPAVEATAKDKKKTKSKAKSETVADLYKEVLRIALEQSGQEIKSWSAVMKVIKSLKTEISIEELPKFIEYVALKAETEGWSWSVFSLLNQVGDWRKYHRAPLYMHEIEYWFKRSNRWNETNHRQQKKGAWAFTRALLDADVAYKYIYFIIRYTVDDANFQKWSGEWTAKACIDRIEKGIQWARNHQGIKHLLDKIEALGEGDWSYRDVMIKSEEDAKRQLEAELATAPQRTLAEAYEVAKKLPPHLQKFIANATVTTAGGEIVHLPL